MECGNSGRKNMKTWTNGAGGAKSDTRGGVRLVLIASKLRTEETLIIRG